MASLPKKHNGMLKFKANTRHFFKIILDKTIRHGKLGFPKKFARKYGNNLSSSIMLEVFDGSVWQVELTKSDGVIWWQKGWQEFVEHYSLAHGHLLVFEFHQRSCHFNVVIFDNSASEIDYPFSDNINEHNLEEEFQEPMIEKTENDDAIVEILDDILPCQKTKGKSSLPFPRPHKMMKFVDDSILHSHSKQVLEGKRDYGGMSFQEATPDSNEIVISKQRLKVKEKSRALHRARAQFKSKYPFFMVAMQPSYVSGGRLAIPASFAMKYFTQRHGDAILNGLDGRTWSVGYYYHKNNSASYQPIAKITHGWRVFAEDNALEVGDVCAFELIKDSKTTFNVSIFNCNQGNGKQLTVTEKASNDKKLIRKPSCSNPIEAAKKFTSEVHPIFKLVIATSHLEHANVYVPENFIMNIQQSSANAKLQVNDRCWPVKLNIYPTYSQGMLSAGWYSFARQNSLKIGDVCIFELIDTETMLIKVSICRNV